MALREPLPEEQPAPGTAPSRQPDGLPPPGDARVPGALRTAAAYSWRLLLVIAAIAALVYAVGKLLVVLVPVIVALVLATVLDGPVRRLERAGWPSWLASLLALVVSIVVIGGVGLVIERRVTAQFDELNVNLDQGLRKVGAALEDSPLPVSRDEVVRGVERTVDELTRADAAIGGLVSGATLVATVLGGIVLAIFALFFLLKDGPRIWRWFVDQFAGERRGVVRELGDRSWATLRSYFRGVIVIASMDTLLIGLALLAVGVPLVLPLMVLTFIGGFFPVLGAFTAGLVAVLVALVSGGAVDALIIAAAIVLIQQFEGNVMYPWVMRQQLRLHPLATVLVVTSGGVLAGVFGAFIAVPLTATVAAAVGYLRGRDRRETPARGTRSAGAAA